MLMVVRMREAPDSASNVASIDDAIDSTTPGCRELEIDGDTVTNTGTLIELPGKPASMRGRTQ
jgi:hypothetical protein